jgi:hypothetical protein
LNGAKNDWFALRFTGLTDDGQKETAKNENGHRDDETGIGELCCQLQFPLDFPRVCVVA